MSTRGADAKDAPKEPSASFLGRASDALFLTGLNPLLKFGTDRQLEVEHFPPLAESRGAESAYLRFKEAWAEEQKRCPESPSLARALFASTNESGLYAKAAWWYMLRAATLYAPALVLKSLVESLEDESGSDAHRWTLATALLWIPLVGSVALVQEKRLAAQAGAEVRTALSMAIYDKALKLSSLGRQQSSTGQIVNLMSADANRAQLMVDFLNSAWGVPLLIILGLVLLGLETDFGALVAIAYLVVTFPFLGVNLRLIRDIRMKILVWADDRVKLLNEVLAGIRIVKFHGWQVPFEGAINGVREKEIDLIRSMAYYIAFLGSLVMRGTAVVLPIVVFAYWAGRGRDMSAATAFSVLALLNVVRAPFQQLPFIFIIYIQTSTALKRIGAFLGKSEIDAGGDAEAEAPRASADTPIRLADARFAWVTSEELAELLKAKAAAAEAKAKDPRQRKRKGKKGGGAKTRPDEEETKDKSASSDSDSGDGGGGGGEGRNLRAGDVLSGVSWEVPRGSFQVVVGPIGCGKTTLLCGILGEVEHRSGAALYRDEGVAYVSQTPFVMNATLKENIVFGAAFDEARYRRVVEGCALLPDIAALPGGDLTEIGEQGINLSGGQKARLALARAAYSDAHVVLMDDPLSAVDAHVAKHLLEECICGELLEGRTRILVTHHLDMVAACDGVLSIGEDGAVEAKPFAGGAGSGSGSDGAGEKASSEGSGAAEEGAAGGEAKPDGGAAEGAGATESDRKEKGRLVGKEGREVGMVQWQARWYYFARTGWLLYVVAAALVLEAALYTGNNFWLARWASDEDGDGLFYFAGYAIIGAATILSMLVTGLAVANARCRASASVHGEMLHSCLSSPVRFFDTTPIGRMLNRFSKDLETIDFMLPRTAQTFASQLLVTVGAAAAILAATRGTLAVVLVFVAPAYFFLQRFTRSSNVAIQRLESVTRSPVYSSFSQMLAGISTIRAFGQSQNFFGRAAKMLDANQVVFVHLKLAAVWMGVRLTGLGALVSFGCGAAAVAFPSFISPSNAALALAVSLTVTDALEKLTSMATSLETQLNSVERLAEYAEGLEGEASVVTKPEAKVGEAWPSRGAVTFEALSARYRDDLPMVLRGVSLEVRAGEKLGIVGRTGSGKSTLANCLFRMMEAAEGRVLIDGVDIASVPLETLRRRVKIIPQDPVLFTGTLRFNLDPHAEHPDAELWEALRETGLEDLVRSDVQGLDAEVAEGGSNFSQGQRQLICMARAYLAPRPKVVILDEATASVDMDTDRLMQLGVRRVFRDSTCITIAHRIQSICDSDRILVMDKGQVGLCRPPLELLEEPGNAFYDLAMEAAGHDAQVFENVYKKIAREGYDA